MGHYFCDAQYGSTTRLFGARGSISRLRAHESQPQLSRSGKPFGVPISQVCGSFTYHLISKSGDFLLLGLDPAFFLRSKDSNMANALINKFGSVNGCLVPDLRSRYTD